MKVPLALCWVILVLGVTLVAICGIVHISADSNFEDNFEIIKTRAGNVKSRDLFIMELDKAISYLEENNLTDGNIIIVNYVKNEDLSLWYYELVELRSEVSSYKENLNEDGVDEIWKIYQAFFEKKLNSIETPKGVSIYLYNVLFCVLFITGLILLLIGGVPLLFYYHN